MPRKIKFVCHAVRWFDRKNGNTYHSVKITRCKDEAVLYGPMQYGYDSHYRQTALELMAEKKWLPPKYRKIHKWHEPSIYMYERENNYPIEWIVSDGLKKECVANGAK